MFVIDVLASNIIIKMGLMVFVGILALLVLLWTLSPAGKYFIKWTIFVTISIIVTTVAIPFALWNPGDPSGALIPAACGRACCILLGLKVKLEGQENVVENSGSVVLINHQSMLDLVVFACLWPAMDNCVVISKREILYIPPIGLTFWLWGTIFIKRGSKNAQDVLNETGELIKKRKVRVLMFPEGTRNLGNKKLLPFKKGAFHLALASNVLIQPVAVSRYTFLKKLCFENGEIRIKILPAISTEGYTRDNINELIDKCYNVLSQNVDLLSGDDVQTNGHCNSEKVISN